MIIRLATPDDARAIAALIAGFQRELTVDPDGGGAEGFLASVSEAAERRYLASPRYRFLVAEWAGALAGFIALRDGSHLFHLFVAAPHQRTGVARTLWRHARDLAERENPGGIVAFTVNASPGAVAAYRAFGFCPAGDFVENDGIRFLPMRLAVAAVPGPREESP